MQIQVNTGHHIEGGEEWTRLVESTVEAAVTRFADRITRVEVHVTDENSNQKGGPDDIRCLMEARLAGLRPISVTHRGASPELALDGAVEKLEKAIEHTLGRKDTAKGGISAAGETTI